MEKGIEIVNIVSKVKTLNGIKKFVEILRKTTLVVLLLLIIIFVVFAIPSVQTYFGKKATSFLQNEFDVAIEINKVGFTFLGEVDLKEVLIRDHHQDTLMYASSIETSILNAREISRGNPILGNVDIENLLFNFKTYKGETSHNLMVFVRKFKSGKKSSSSTKFLLTAGRIRITDADFNLVNENLKKPDVISYKNIDIDADRLMVDGTEVYIDMQSLAFEDSYGLIVDRLSTCFVIKTGQMLFQELEIETKDSFVSGEIKFDYKGKDLLDFVNKVKVKAQFDQGRISTNDLIPFYKEFGKNQMIKIKNSTVTGTLNNFKVKNANLKGLDRSVIRGDLKIQNAVTNMDQFRLEGDFKNLSTNYYDLINLLPRLLGTSLPEQLQQLGNVKGKGNAIVTIKTVDLDMNFSSQLGSINAFVLLDDLNTDAEAIYNGNVISSNFDLGRLLGKKSLGNAKFDIQVDGKGFTLDKLDTKIEGDIQKLEFNKYPYSRINVFGNVKNSFFDGKLTSYDPNIKFSFNGIADFSQEVNNYDFVAHVDHIDLKKLNIFTRDDVAVFNGDVYMKVKGTNINNAYGTIEFEKTLYTNQNASYYFDDFNITSSFDAEGVRTISVNSPDIIEGQVKGKYRFQNVYDLFSNSIGSLYANFQPTEVTDDEFMEFNFKIYNKIVDVFFPDVEFAANTFIKGKVESNDAEFKLNFKSPRIKAFENEMEAIDIQVDNKNPLFNTYVAIDSIHSKHYDISEFSLINVTLKDTLFMRTEFKGGKNNEDNYNLKFYHTINEDNRSVVGIRQSNFIFKGYEWLANPERKNDNNKIIFDNKFQKVDIKPIVFTHKGEEISISGLTRGKDFKDIKASLNKVALHKITPTIDSLKLGGTVNGDLSIFQDEGKYYPSSMLVIDDLKINDIGFGALSVSTLGNESLTEYQVNAGLVDENEVKTLSAIGSINVAKATSRLDIDVDVNQLDVAGFSPLGGIVISDIRGKVEGNAKITGSFGKPSFDGVMRLNDAGLKVPYLNVDMDFEPNATVLLEKQRFNFDYFTITDTTHKTNGVLGGFIEHQLFSDWVIGLELLADERLLVLDTQEDEESLYYGTAFISGEASIQGPTDELVIDVSAKSEEGTIFKIPLNDSESLGDNSFIHFLSPEEKKARLEGKEIVLEDLKGLELNFDLDVNNNAEVEIVIDKKTGSSLKGRGAGILRIEINTNGKFNMWGDFVAYEGIYNFRYGAFVEKVFTVRDGGTIVWDGSPTRARLDLSAVYKTEANPAILLENSTINRDIPVEVVVDLQGELAQPNLGFNIEFPNLSSVVRSEIDYQLEDQSARELQALSLVTQGQFYSNLTLGQNVITGNLVERASSLVNGIFSDQDDKFKIGLNYVQADRALTQNQQSTDQFGLTVSTHINNRILINGRVGVPIGGVSESVVVGDVEVEYLFNKDGSLRGKIFNRQNDIQYIGQNQGYTQGGGLSYSVDFDNFRELWREIFKNKAKIKDSISSPRQKDTIQQFDTPNFINFTDQNN